MKILILAVHYEVTGARYIADAFTRLGHDVKHIGVLVRIKEAWGIPVDDKYIWKPDNVDLYEWTPDLVIIADTQTRYENTFPDVPVIKWTQDNHVRNVREDGIDHYFLAHAHGPAQPVTEADETWLPCAADTTVFTPSVIPWAEREYDVCMVGVMYPRRTKLVQMMKEAGLKVFAATGLVYEEYAKAYQNARISLCVSAAGDVAQRVFETAAMGCTVLTDLLLDLTDDETNRKLGLQGFFVYQNDEEAVSIAKDLVTNESAMAQFGALTLQKIVRERHTWEQRCQVVVDWYEQEYGNVKMVEAVNQRVDSGEPIDYELGSGIKLASNWKVAPLKQAIDAKPYLNLGCGKTHFPSAPPPGHEVVDDDIYNYPLWLNVDKVEGVGADKVFDLFTYPWPLEDNSFDGAGLFHILEHVPHEIKRSFKYPVPKPPDGIVAITNGNERESWEQKRWREIEHLQDGWYAFFSELYRVLTPGALVHIVSPYGFSDGGITDPSHCRYLTMNSFTHSMTPDISDGSTFKYNNGGINFVIEGNPQYRMTPYAETLKQRTGFDYDFLMGTYLNTCYDFYLKLKVVK